MGKIDSLDDNFTASKLELKQKDENKALYYSLETCKLKVINMNQNLSDLRMTQRK